MQVMTSDDVAVRGNAALAMLPPARAVAHVKGLNRAANQLNETLCSPIPPVHSFFVLAEAPVSLSIVTTMYKYTVLAL